MALDVNGCTWTQLENFLPCRCSYFYGKRRTALFGWVLHGVMPSPGGMGAPVPLPGLYLFPSCVNTMHGSALISESIPRTPCIVKETELLNIPCQCCGPGGEPCQCCGPGGEPCQCCGPGGEPCQCCGPGESHVSAAVLGESRVSAAVLGESHVSAAVLGESHVSAAVPARLSVDSVLGESCVCGVGCFSKTSRWRVRCPRPQFICLQPCKIFSFLRFIFLGSCSLSCLKSRDLESRPVVSCFCF
ncbi:hypothetical protein ANANG_G00285470 [Anguilla anguilla]|uniref:Uncharacterized protein n=1 Tax=Anguilla anguilla TaxID=7936 RepID=A0A9D3RJ41_ANGAN|nr:hypothetical protein ANANG_G00285470 [Anguilla anguilla]